jgi:hypothetical protein
MIGWSFEIVLVCYCLKQNIYIWGEKLKIIKVYFLSLNYLNKMFFFFIKLGWVKLKKSVFTFLKSNKALLTNAFFFFKKKQEKQPFLKKKLNLGNISIKNFSWNQSINHQNIIHLWNTIESYVFLWLQQMHFLPQPYLSIILHKIKSHSPYWKFMVLARNTNNNVYFVFSFCKPSKEFV